MYKKAVMYSPPPSTLPAHEVLQVKEFLLKNLRSSLPLSFSSNHISFTSFDYEVETDQWHFTLTIEVPVPQNFRSIKMGEKIDTKHKTIADYMKHVRIDLFQAMKNELGHLYFVSSNGQEYQLKPPPTPEYIALYDNDEKKWKLLNQAERILFKHQYPTKKNLMDYAELMIEKNMFGFDENNKDQPFFPLVYSHVEVNYSFILSNLTYQYYRAEKQKQKKRAG